MYVRTDSAGRGKWKRIPPLSPREGCPLLFQKALEMVDKSESDNWVSLGPGSALGEKGKKLVK